MKRIESYKVYAEDMDGNRRFIAESSADKGGNGLFDLYADECGDEEEIVIVSNSSVCESCGSVMDRFNDAGQEYKICLECSKNLDDPCAGMLSFL